jgi:toxin HigB-1
LLVMIRSFRGKDTEKLFQRSRVSRFVGIDRVALRKLQHLNAAERLSDLAIPPGNHLERLSGKRQGQHSIRINSQWRICFIWREESAHDVEIVDYH